VSTLKINKQSVSKMCMTSLGMQLHAAGQACEKPLSPNSVRSFQSAYRPSSRPICWWTVGFGDCVDQLLQVCTGARSQISTYNEHKIVAYAFNLLSLSNRDNDFNCIQKFLPNLSRHARVWQEKFLASANTQNRPLQHFRPLHVVGHALQQININLL